MTMTTALTYGKKINDWTLLNPYGERYWICICKCGTEKRVDKYSLKNGSSKRCRTCAYQERKYSKFAKDLSGKNYHDWTVISREDGKFDEPYWNCQCKCGKKSVVSGSSLKKGGSKRCRSCASREKPRPEGLNKCVDITGKSFGYWHVLHKEESRNCKARWMCKCKCGKMKIVVGQSLLNGSSTKCSSCNVSKISKTHGHTVNGKTPEYHIWGSIKERCRNENNINYPNYGGRGIKICKEWECSFESFLSDVGKRPNEKLSLDRIDNNGNYEPGNVRWTTRKIQASNTRRQKYGICISQWSREKNLCRFQVAEMLKKGFDLCVIERSIKKPFKDYHFRVEEILEAKTGIDVDLTPLTNEQQKSE